MAHDASQLTESARAPGPTVVATPLVSVVVPARNSATTIARALDSVLAQTYRPFEIIVVDDASDDETAKIVAAYGEPSVRLVRLDRQGGASGARNAGIEAAHGALIAFLDSDDEWLPSKLAKQVALIVSDERCVFVSCASRLISPDGKDLGDLYRGRRPTSGSEAWRGLLGTNTIATPSVLVWRHVIIELGGFDQNLKICEDQDMWIRLASRGDLGYVDETLVRVHTRANSLSSRGFADLTHYTMMMLPRRIEAQRGKLTPGEIRRIMGEQLQRLGRAACNEDYFAGCKLILRSAFLGYQPLDGLVFLASASPPARWLKRCFRTMTGWQAKSYQAAVPVAAPLGSTPMRVPSPFARARHPLLANAENSIVRFPADEKPRLVVIVDAEEDFDWRKPFSPSNNRVQSMSAQFRAQAIFARYGLIPTYAIDYPIVTQEAGYRPLHEMLEAGTCEIGAQLHAWVTPPHEEEVCERNSYAGNLPRALERQKLEVLTEAIEKRFGFRPQLYRAGRYGTGESTAEILDALGYEIDCSVLPGVWRGSVNAPDYSGATAHPYWLAARRQILEIPVTVGTIGAARVFGDELYRTITSDLGSRLRIPGIMASLRILNRARLSPEGNTLDESKRLTRSLVAQGYRVFAISYHSPSLEPGNTPYVRNRDDLLNFLGWIEGYMEFFFGEIGGVADTPKNVRKWAVANSPWQQREAMPLKARVG